MTATDSVAKQRFPVLSTPNFLSRHAQHVIVTTWRKKSGSKPSGARHGRLHHAVLPACRSKIEHLGKRGVLPRAKPRDETKRFPSSVLLVLVDATMDFLPTPSSGVIAAVVSPFLTMSYSCNDNQNYFVSQGRTTSKVSNPPGGKTSISLGYEEPPKVPKRTCHSLADLSFGGRLSSSLSNGFPFSLYRRTEGSQHRESARTRSEARERGCENRRADARRGYWRVDYDDRCCDQRGWQRR